MAVYNIDETIKSLLNAYVMHTSRILHKEYRDINAKVYENKADYDAAMESYVTRVVAHDFLRLIESDVKHYLYKKTNIHLSRIEGDKDTIYQKLSAICGPRFDNGTMMLVKLSQAISSHVNYVGETDKPWVYNDKGLYDGDAKEILELNKQIQLMNANSCVRLFKDFIKPQRFAVKEK